MRDESITESLNLTERGESMLDIFDKVLDVAEVVAEATGFDEVAKVIDAVDDALEAVIATEQE